MAAKWQFGTVGIYVDDEEVMRPVKRAELFVLDATSSTFHYFGAGSKRFNLKGIVIGETDRNQLESWAINDTAQTLTTPWGNTANCRIDGDVKATAIKYSGATIDGTAYSVDTTPLYRIELDVIT